MENITYLSVKCYCKKYHVSRNKLLDAAHSGKIHSIRNSVSWSIVDEPINTSIILGIHVAYIASTLYGVEYASYIKASDYDEALYICREMGWRFDTSAHGWQDSYEALIFIGNL